MTTAHATTPRAAGYRWPAEWERHAATWIAWPHNRDTWPGHFADIPAAFARVIETLAQYEPVNVLAASGPVADQADALVGSRRGVTLFSISTNDAWVRDYGPMFLTHPDGSVAAVDWQFNSWGGKYPPWDADNAATREICAALDIYRFPVQCVLEGGAVDTNGAGMMLTTSSCLLDPRRNGSIDKPGMTEILSQFATCNKIIWLPGRPLAGDDTDGHVDQVARFVGQDQIVVALEDDPADANYGPLQDNLAHVRFAGNTGGIALQVTTLPMPRPIFFDAQRVPASYGNFYIANGCVIVPQFDDPHDGVACATLREIFADRDVIGLPARAIVWGLGAFHCLTQQQPRAW